MPSTTDSWNFYLEIENVFVELKFEKRDSVCLFLDIVSFGQPGTYVQSLEMICIPVKSGKLQRDGDPIVQGLLLEASDNRLGEFRRFGCFKIEGVKQVGLFNEACQYFDSNADQIGLKYTRDTEGVQKYEIIIA
jgi:hypothetical protein